MLIFQKVKNGGMSICVNCSHRKVCKGIDNQPCVECNQFFNEDKQPQTNADRIRAMSDEELAELFGAVIREREIILLQKLREQGVEASIVEMPELTFNAHLKWLKQPAEVTDNGE